MMGGTSVTMRATLRTLLNTTHKDGLTLSQAATLLGTNKANVEKCFKGMADVYVDRWNYPTDARGKQKAGAPFKIYCAVPIPEDCPPPEPAVARAPATKPIQHGLYVPTNPGEGA